MSQQSGGGFSLTFYSAPAAPSPILLWLLPSTPHVTSLSHLHPSCPCYNMPPLLQSLCIFYYHPPLPPNMPPLCPCFYLSPLLQPPCSNYPPPLILLCPFAPLLLSTPLPPPPPTTLSASLVMSQVNFHLHFTHFTSPPVQSLLPNFLSSTCSINTVYMYQVYVYCTWWSNG